MTTIAIEDLLDGAALAEHTDPRNWTKDLLLNHLFQHDPSFYYGSSSTKASFVRAHVSRHEWTVQRAARLVELTPIMAELRAVFGCRLNDHGFAVASDEWIADHVYRHEAGDDLGGRLL